MFCLILQKKKNNMEKINISTITEQCGIEYNKNIYILDDLKSLYEETTPRQMLIEGFVFGIVLQGSVRIIIDNVEYTLEKGDIFACNPHNILERSMVSMDLKVLGFFATPDYAARLLHNIHVDWSFLMIAKTHEIIHAQDDELERLVAYIELLRKKLNATMSNGKEESISLLIQSMGLEVFDIRERQQQQPHHTDFSPAENLVQRFMLMLAESSQHGTPYLNVNGYAERLNVSAKYFSAVCKKILGKTASEVIKEDIINTATVLLHDNSLSIKQISDRLGFANQSHFGTFFRRHMGGKSPQQVRKS